MHRHGAPTMLLWSVVAAVSRRRAGNYSKTTATTKYEYHDK
jgi:hypothetical protein